MRFPTNLTFSLFAHTDFVPKIYLVFHMSVYVKYISRHK